jgi:hypothetical protein
VLTCLPCESLNTKVSTWISENQNVNYYCEKGGEPSDFHDLFFTDDEKDYFDLLEWAEDEFTCSGICVKAKIYLFSEVDDGIPEDKCMDKVKEWVDDSVLAVAIPLLCLGTWLLVTVIISLCACCHPDLRAQIERTESYEYRVR